MILITLVLLNVLNCPAPGSEQDVKRRTEQWLCAAGLSDDKLKIAVELNGLFAPEVIYYQSRLETGNFKSELCIEHNNLFGMRLARTRPTTATGATENNYASYATWYDSVRDMKLFQEYYVKKGYRLPARGCPPAPLKGGEYRKETDSYLLFLRAIGYAEDPGYLKKLEGLCLL